MADRGPKIEGRGMGHHLTNRKEAVERPDHTSQQDVKLLYPVIPERDGVGLPLEADLVIRVFADLAEQQREDGVRLRFGDPNNTTSEPCMRGYQYVRTQGSCAEYGAMYLD